MRNVFCVGSLAFLLTACVSSPTTTPQETRLAPATLGLGSAQMPMIGDAWWKSFGDPKLDSLVEQALQGNPSLKAALDRVRNAQSQLAASTAATYPQVTFDGNVVRQRLSSDYIIPPPYGGTTRWVGTLQANLSYSLDLFGKEQDQIDRAQASTNAAALDAEAARLLLAGCAISAAMASGFAGGRSRRAVVDITEIKLFVTSG